MRRLPVILLLFLCAPLARPAAPSGVVYSPGPGILCDKKAGICADSQGLSLAFTKAYLGAKAEAILLDRIKEAGGPALYDLTWFGFSSGVDCKVKEKVCHESKYSPKINWDYTRTLFGR